MTTKVEQAPADRACLEVPQPVHDPWRKTMGLNLRSEAAKFMLAAFNLDVFSDLLPGSSVSLSRGAMEKWFAQRLARFLASEMEAHYGLAHHRFIVLRAVKAVTDVSVCEFGDDGAIRELTPVFDARQPADPDSAAVRTAIHAVVSAFNATRTMPERERPMRLRTLAGNSPAAQRLLASTVVSFENAGSRFEPPAMLTRRGFPESSMAVVWRRSPDGRSADLWLQCHHAGADCVPAQEMLDRLESSWGVTSPVLLPADAGFQPRVPRTCHATNERRVGLITDFIDFTPLVQLRRRLIEEFSRPDESVSLAGILMWCLAHQPEFAGAGMNTSVEVPPAGGHPRASGLIALWPARYWGKPGAFLSFLDDLNELAANTRLRKSGTWEKMARLAAVPSAVSYAILHLLESGMRDGFGTLTLCMVESAKLVVAPMPDRGWDHGFIAVGKPGMPAESGPPVTPVSIKGDPDRIAAYPAAIRRAIANCRDYVK